MLSYKCGVCEKRRVIDGSRKRSNKERRSSGNNTAHDRFAAKKGSGVKGGTKGGVKGGVKKDFVHERTPSPVNSGKPAFKLADARAKGARQPTPPSAAKSAKPPPPLLTNSRSGKKKAKAANEKSGLMGFLKSLN
jgi:hypothetical protein